MRLNRRGRRVRALLIAALVIALIYALSAYLWYTPRGYCLGTLSGCLGI
jgi:ABC-type dipeptide/oligopeptide/nickel transport system permease subunit